MQRITVRGPSPHNLAEIKNYLRIFHDEEDGIIQAIYDSALSWIEGRTRRYLQDITIEVLSDEWVEMYRLPDREASTTDLELKYVAADTTEKTISTAYINCGVVHLGYKPDDFSSEMTLTVNSTASSEKALDHAILLLTAMWYENRGDQNIRGVPAWIDRICGTFTSQRF